MLDECSMQIVRCSYLLCLGDSDMSLRRDSDSPWRGKVKWWEGWSGFWKARAAQTGQALNGQQCLEFPFQRQWQPSS